MAEARKLSDWVSGYLEYTSAQESPESLHKWTALTVISAAMRRRVFIAHEYQTIYPNMYVIIVAESAKVRKSTAMDLGRNLLLEALPTLTVFRDSGTSQGLIKMLNRDSKIEGKEAKLSDVAIFADEVANLFGYEKTRASQMVIFLTRAYGCPAVYDHTTVRDSVVRLFNLYPVLLGGTDPRNLKVLPEDAIGGLTGRLIWVIESQRRANNPGWKQSNRAALERAAIREALIHDLQLMSQLMGEVTVTPEGQELYNAWYDELSGRNTRDPETDAFYHRCHTTALRISILLSLSDRSDLLVTVDHIKEAIKLIEQQLPETKRVTMWSGGSQFEQHRAKFIHFLQQAPKNAATRQQLLQYMAIDATAFQLLIDTVIQSAIVTQMTIKGVMIYVLTKEGINEKVSEGAEGAP